MYKIPTFRKTGINVNQSTEGETMEMKIRRIMENNEPLEGATDAIYTPRDMGVIEAYDIRSDKFDIALDAMDTAHKGDLNKRQTSIAERKKALDDMNKKGSEEDKKIGKTEPTSGGTDNAD